MAVIVAAQGQAAARPPLVLICAVAITAGSLFAAMRLGKLRTSRTAVADL
jgi:hypothetical protein